MSKDLNPEKALIFRITHRDNVPWIIDNGLYCKNSENLDPNFVDIGNLDLIHKRQRRFVEVASGGTLSDYIPFYFTPFSPMMYNITTGYRGITQRRNEEIVILVTSLHKLADDGVDFIFSDRHAYLSTAQFSADLADLDRIDWPILQARDFERDSEDPGKFERYEAEALVHRHLPVESLLGIVGYNQLVERQINDLLAERDLELKIVAKSDWYFG